MTNVDPQVMASIDKAMDTLIIAVSHLNSVLVRRGLQPVTQPQRHLPIEPFFDDMTRLIELLIPLADDA